MEEIVTKKIRTVTCVFCKKKSPQLMSRMLLYRWLKKNNWHIHTAWQGPNAPIEKMYFCCFEHRKKYFKMIELLESKPNPRSVDQNDVYNYSYQGIQTDKFTSKPYLKTTT